MRQVRVAAVGLGVAAAAAAHAEVLDAGAVAPIVDRDDEPASNNLRAHRRINSGVQPAARLLV